MATEKIFAAESLPQDYIETKKIDLQRDTRLLVWINLLSLSIAAVFALIGCLVHPILPWYREFYARFLTKPFANIFALLLLVVAMVVYMIGHELIHGVFFKKYSGKKPKYGFTGIYAFAHCEAYYPRKQYLIIGLAPVVLFGALFLLLNLCLPALWFWSIYILQIINLSGAAGDAYVTAVLLKQPADILIYDEGTGMTVFAKE
jgi:hypothetical protein